MIQTHLTSQCVVEDLGLIDYNKAYAIQKATVDQVIPSGISKLLMCEHYPVLTLGRLASERFILQTKDELRARNIEVHHVDRGGEVTLHSPGQLVVYPIIDLNHHGKDLHLYLHRLEKVIIDLLNDFGIVARRQNGNTGVWIKADKIASIGIGVKKWISFHGFAINVNTDLNLFSLIRPCGLDVRMTSISELMGQAIDMNSVKKSVVNIFADHFDLNVIHK